jgi:hypothetical protein
MSLLKDLFKNLTESLVENHHYADSLYFTTDLARYDFVKSRYLDLKDIKAGESFTPVECIGRCIREKQPVVDSVAQKPYGVNLRVRVWPIIEDDEVTGTYGYMTPRCDPVAEVFDDIAQSAIESFTEKAFVSVITSRARNRRRPAGLSRGKK